MLDLISDFEDTKQNMGSEEMGNFTTLNSVTIAEEGDGDDEYVLTDFSIEATYGKPHHDTQKCQKFEDISIFC